MTSRTLPLRLSTSLTIVVLGIVAFVGVYSLATAAPPANGDAAVASELAPATDENGVAAQIKELQKQVAELQKRLGDDMRPRIVAAGTAKVEMGATQNNSTFAHVKLSPEVAAKLGEDYVVVISSRFPSSGYPFYTPFWKPAKDGFDVTMVDVTLAIGGSASYSFKTTKTFLVDWIVVRK